MNAPARQSATPLASLGVEDLITLTERLTGLLARETTLLAERRPAALADTREEKERLAAIYAREMAAFKANAARLRAHQPGLIERLKQATAKFRQAMDAHTIRLSAMKTVTDRVIQAIGEEVAKRNRPMHGYDKNALMSPIYGSRSTARPATLALNQVI